MRMRNNAPGLGGGARGAIACTSLYRTCVDPPLRCSLVPRLSLLPFVVPEYRLRRDETGGCNPPNPPLDPPLLLQLRKGFWPARGSPALHRPWQIMVA